MPPLITQGQPVPLVRLAINSMIMELHAQRYNVMLPIVLFVMIPILARPVMSAFMSILVVDVVPVTAQ